MSWRRKNGLKNQLKATHLFKPENKKAFPELTGKAFLCYPNKFFDSLSFYHPKILIQIDGAHIGNGIVGYAYGRYGYVGICASGIEYYFVAATG